MFDYRLALMTGVDIPIPELQITVHQPTIKEISMVGEQDFFLGIQLLCIDKNAYVQDERLLQQTNNFQLFMAIINEPQTADKKVAVLQVLTLLFPKARVNFTPRSMLLSQDGVIITIDEGNFKILQEILIQQFCLQGSGQEQFKPQDKKAREIAQKLMKARQRVAKQKSSSNSGSMFAQYLSVLTVGLGSFTLKEAMELTMYQVYDLIERYNKYLNWDIDIRSRMAGAKADKPIENWMDNIHKH